MTLQQRALPHTRASNTSHSPSLFGSLLQDGRFFANPGLGQMSDEGHCLLRPSPRDIACQHHQPGSATWGTCALCVATHHSATTIPQWCPPPVLHRTQGGRPPQPPKNGEVAHTFVATLPPASRQMRAAAIPYVLRLHAANQCGTKLAPHLRHSSDWAAPQQPNQPKRNFETFQTSELICRPC